MTYFTNKDLCVELIISKAQGKLTEKSILILKILCKIIMRSLKIPTKDDRLDCYQSSLYDTFKYWHNYDVEKHENAFGYFSYLIKRSLTWGTPVKKDINYIRANKELIAVNRERKLNSVLDGVKYVPFLIEETYEYNKHNIKLITLNEGLHSI
jgi:hypothetical protein